MDGFFAFFGLVLWAINFLFVIDISKKKGHDQTGWGALAFFFGPLATIYLAIYPINEREVEKRKLREGSLKYCERCWEVIRAEAVRCHYCGFFIPQKDEKKETDSWQPPPPLTRKQKIIRLSLAATIAIAYILYLIFK